MKSNIHSVLRDALLIDVGMLRVVNVGVGEDSHSEFRVMYHHAGDVENT